MKIFENAKIEVISFDVEDVIATSGIEDAFDGDIDKVDGFLN